MARAWGELVAAGIESKRKDGDRALEATYREFEQCNHEIHKQWDGVSREANERLGPVPRSRRTTAMCECRRQLVGRQPQDNDSRGGP